MKGLIIKDILNLKKSLVTTLIIILLYSLFSLNTGDTDVLIGIAVFITAFMSITSLAYDDMAKWDIYALAMPVTRRDIVLSKYILALIFALTAALVASILSIVISYIRDDLRSVENIQEILLSAYIVLSVCMVFISIIMPLVFKFGVENARILMAGIIIVPMGIGYFLTKMGIQLPSEEQIKILLYASPIIVFLLLILSASITYGIYKKKDI